MIRVCTWLLGTSITDCGGRYLDKKWRTPGIFDVCMSNINMMTLTIKKRNLPCPSPCHCSNPQTDQTAENWQHKEENPWLANLKANGDILWQKMAIVSHQVTNVYKVSEINGSLNCQLEVATLLGSPYFDNKRCVIII